MKKCFNLDFQSIRGHLELCFGESVLKPDWKNGAYVVMTISVAQIFQSLDSCMSFTCNMGV